MNASRIVSQVKYCIWNVCMFFSLIQSKDIRKQLAVIFSHCVCSTAAPCILAVKDTPTAQLGKADHHTPYFYICTLSFKSLWLERFFFFQWTWTISVKKEIITVTCFSLYIVFSFYIQVYTLTKIINATLLFLPPFFMSWTQRSKTFSMYTKGLFLSNIVHESV